MALAKLGRCRLSLLYVDDLESAGFFIDHTGLTLGPVVGVVMVVNPQHDINVTGIGLEHNGAIGFINTNRSHQLALAVFDGFVVDARRGGVLPKQVDKLRDLLLGIAGELAVGIKELIRDGEAKCVL